MKGYMPKYSVDSLRKLNECHPDLQTLFKEVINHFDNTIICGHRGEAEQNAAFNSGHSKLKYPKGKHNSNPSNALDARPFPFDNDLGRFKYFAGFVLGIAAMLKAQGKITHSIRWGGDWNMNNILSDNSFNDLFHFEIHD